MGDSYQAIYEAARRALGHVDMQGALTNAFDISHQKQIALDIFSENAYRVGEELCRPSVLLRDQLTYEQNPEGWTCTHAAMTGYGKSPDEAGRDFDKKWRGQ